MIIPHGDGLLTRIEGMGAGFQIELKEGYSVDIVLVFTWRGAPNTADCPLQPPKARRFVSVCSRRMRSGVETTAFDGNKVRIVFGRKDARSSRWFSPGNVAAFAGEILKARLSLLREKCGNDLRYDFLHAEIADGIP